ncbi:MAG: tetratricopeptide repeat protein, partial [Desulfobacteraceae bacterium]|nr:tetratricopeptide repeat protein [Desulfobacteraceae bacterium]
KPLRPIQTFLGIVILIAAGIIVYSNTFHSPFLFDDDGFIVNNYAIRMTGLSWDAIKKAALEGFPAHRYLPNISFALNYDAGRLNPFGYHLVNLIIHLLSGIFLFFFIQNTLRVHPGKTRDIHPELIAFFAALIWLVQPVGAQAVTYICQRMASMVALFYILSLILYVKGRMAMRRDPGKFTIPGLYFSGCAIIALCALATKENAGTLPLVILLYEWFFFQDLRLKWSRRRIMWTGFFVIAFAGTAFWFLGGTPVKSIMAGYSYRDFTLPQRVMTEWRIMVYYISLFLWAPPGRLNLDHDYPLSVSPVDPPATMIALAAIIGLLVLAAYSAKKDRLISFCILWFFITQATESTIIGIELIFEHRTYIPFMMTSLLFVLLAFRLVKNRPLAYGLLAAAAIVFSVWTFQRNQTWRAPVTFWSDSAAKSPGKFRPHNDLGVALYDAGDINGAIIQYEKAISIDPGHADARNNLGNALFKQGRTDEAIQCFETALSLNPGHTKARNNLANALAQKGRLPEAIQNYQIILNEHPDHVEANINMGAALARLGRIDEALIHYQAAIKSDPYNPEVFNNMGVLFVQKNKPEEALACFQKALELRPGYESAINNLRRLEQMGK